MIAALLSGGPAWIFVKVVTIAFTLVSIAQLLPAPVRQVPVYRGHPVRWTVAYAAGIAIAAVLAGCAIAGVARHPQARAAGRPAPARPGVRIGMFAPGMDASYVPERKFAAATGARVSYVLSYAAWPDASFDARFALIAASHGATPVIHLMPSAGSMDQLAEGAFDARIRSYADEVRAFGHPLILSFAPEANGNWYGWGWGHTPPAEWVAAWRHVVTIFRAEHAANVTWMWTVNVPFPHSGPLAAYWPGAAYVGMVGIDGYFARPSDTFASVFGGIISQVRGLTRDPVLISETAAGPDSGARREAQIRGLFAGAKADRLLGFVWFDEAQHDGPYHQDWRLEDDPAALAAFRAEVRKHG